MRSNIAPLRKEAPSFGNGISIVDPAEWEGKAPPRREWMVENCFLKGTVAIVSGDGGKGKSLLMQQLCTCAALGRPWLGLDLLPGKSLYLACEDDRDELWRRQAHINRHLDTTMIDVSEAGLRMMPRIGCDNALGFLDRSTWRMAETELFEKLRAIARFRGFQYIVVDTATQTFRGNQNDETQVMDYVTILRRLAILIEGVVILTKHPSMAGRNSGTGESGSVAWENSVRSRLYLHETEKDGLTLTTVKSNYGPPGAKIKLRWENGVFVRDEPDYGRRWDEVYR